MALCLLNTCNVSHIWMFIEQMHFQLTVVQLCSVCPEYIKASLHIVMRFVDELSKSPISKKQAAKARVLSDF